jgi:hypothetical protein
LKQKFDPTNVFWCSPCVGADLLTYDDERICENPSFKPSTLSSLGITPGGRVNIPPPNIFANEKSKAGIGSLPGVAGIPHPFLAILTDFLVDKKLPPKMLKSNYFKIAMGEGGSALGKYADNDPYNPGQKLKDWPLKW